MIRRIIQIDEEKCNGCGACASACHENAIGMVNGKAKLMREDYCDGLGDCLPACPTGAITFVEREAAEYDEAAVETNKMKIAQQKEEHHHKGGCPGSRIVEFNKHDTTQCPSASVSSQLRQWPVQIKLAPINAPYFNGANLLIAADCSAYSYGNFHNDFIKGKITLIGCPKLDSVDYTDKLTEIIKNNNIQSVTIVRMEVPCCGGLENAVISAVQNSGKSILCQVVTISIDGKILSTSK